MWDEHIDSSCGSSPPSGCTYAECSGRAWGSYAVTSETLGVEVVEEAYVDQGFQRSTVRFAALFAAPETWTDAGADLAVLVDYELEFDWNGNIEGLTTALAGASG